MSGEATRAFNDAVRKDPGNAYDQWRRLQDAFETRGITFGGRAMPTFLRPQFVDRPTWDALTAGSIQLIRISERVARTVFDGDIERLLDFLGAPESHRQLLRLDPPGPDVSLSRVDGFVVDGKVRFIEINSDAPAGFGYSERMTEVFSALPLVAQMKGGAPDSVDSVDALVQELRSHARIPNPRVAIVDLRTVRTKPDQEILREEFERRGLATVLVDPRDMEIVNDRLVAEGAAVDVVYRRTVIAEVLAIETEAPAFFEAYRRALCVFVNSFRCYLSEDKAFMAILTDERYAGLLSSAERAFIAAHVPWTRKVEDRRTEHDGVGIDLVRWTLSHRDACVLKPTHGYGGASVIIGSSVTDPVWRTSVETAVNEGGWIVQERVTIPEEEFPVFDDKGSLRFESLKVNTNPFYVGGASVGAVTRVSRDPVINVSAGGGSIPTLIA
ncbi:MAG: circularly permuted type 2 ATP-grasp protein [Vicinamibacteria bacterium]